MNEVSIGTTILYLRKKKGITQEHLANMIGISAGAVSKWETGNSKPDIDLLAPLARALNTSLNELLSFKEELTETEIIQIKNKLREIFLHFGFLQGESKCKEYLKKYPNSIGLKLIVASLIQIYSMLLDNNFHELVRAKKQYALSLLYEVVDSNESKYTQNALFIIANIEMELGNYAESEKCLKELSNSFVDPMILYASLLQKQSKNKDAENLCKKMLLQYLTQSTAMMTILSSIAKENHNFEKSILYLYTLNKIENKFKIGLCSGAYNLCKLYIDEGKKELAAKWFKNYVDGLLSTDYDYANNPYFEGLQLEVDAEGQSIIRKKLYQTLLDESDLKELEGLEQYEHAIKKLKATLST